jgi:hypothetical protein
MEPFKVTQGLKKVTQTVYLLIKTRRIDKNGKKCLCPIKEIEKYARFVRRTNFEELIYDEEDFKYDL